ncbi:MAG TPA: MobB family relaxase [Flavobacteriaceae bacterium]
MYISITKQHLESTFSQSAADFVDYLEKENEEKEPDLQEHFFDQNNNHIAPEHVVKDIDGNTAKLKKTEPKFYALTINPSQKELKAIHNDPALLRTYVREVMKDYAASFYRETPISVDSIKYYAKIEHERRFKGYDREIKENQVFKAKIAKLNNDIRKVVRGELQGNVKAIQLQIEKLKAEIPHRIDGEIIEQGMKKPGVQTHVHIIVSRKDTSNTFSISPGSQYKASESTLNGMVVKRGFNRDEFFKNAEKTFDRLFKYDRNFVETYTARKAYIKDPYTYFAHLMQLPTTERSVAFKLLEKAGVNTSPLDIPTNKVQLALKTLKQLKKSMDLVKGASSIGI